MYGWNQLGLLFCVKKSLFQRSSKSGGVGVCGDAEAKCNVWGEEGVSEVFVKVKGGRRSA